MDKTFLVIGFFMIVVGIPVIADVLNKMHKRNTALRERELDVLGSQTAEKAAQYAAQVERLEQRVRVLERIATDRGADLSDEIELLRDEREHGATPRLGGH
ncbi:uncharacterized protein YlxW (UPF0749 family) [Sphingobium xanthum]|jgi:uncharacterized protein YlxW (UPF0749 family)|nr:hypothetical protein [Sphingobium xanthum]